VRTTYWPTDLFKSRIRPPWMWHWPRILGSLGAIAGLYVAAHTIATLLTVGI